MKVRDIKAYRELILGENENLELKLGCGDPLLVKLDGANSKIDPRIEQMTGFAVKASEQIFYELLQNAKDANSNSFAVVFNKNGILFLNNGEPFKTRNPIPNINQAPNSGELIGLLQLGKSPKYGVANSIGKFGIGFKLLYDLLHNENGEGVNIAIKESLKGPIIYSWSKLSQLEKILVDEIVYIEKDCDDALPLLTKIVLTYFPSNYKEIGIVENKLQGIELFDDNELQDLKSFLQLYFNQHQKLEYETGTAIYLPINEFVFEQIDKSYTNGLKKNLCISLNLVSGIRKIEINSERLDKKELIILELPYIENSGQNVENKTNINGAKNCILFFKNEKPQTSFYNYFPVFDEYYGFNFIIHSPYLSLPPDRQKIDWTKNAKILENIENEYIDALQKLAEDKQNFDKYLLIFKSIIHKEETDKFNQTDEIKDFYDNLIKFLKQNIPTNKKTIRPFNEVLNNTSVLEFELNDFGITKDWVNEELIDYTSELINGLRVEDYNIGFCLRDTDVDYTAWVYSLSQDNYTKLLLDILDSNISPQEKGQLPIIKVSNGSLIRRSDLVKDDCKVIPLNSSTKPLTEIFDSYEIYYTDNLLLHNIELAWYITNPNIQEKKLFERIHNNLFRKDLHPYEKCKIFQVFQKSFDYEDGFLRRNVSFFKNIKNVKYYLRFLIFDHLSIASSGMLMDFYLNPIERCDHNIEPYCFQINEVWDFINSNQNWQKHIIENLLYNSFRQIIKDLDAFYQSSNSKSTNKLDSQINWILCDDGEFYAPSIVFLNSHLTELIEPDYNILTDFIKLNSDLKKIDFKYYKDVQNVSFAEWEQNNLKAHLRDKLIITSDEIILLAKLKETDSFFTNFYLAQNYADFFLCKHTENIIQYTSDDQALINFLDPNEFKLLPKLLLSVFQEDAGLKKDNDSTFISLLILKFLFNNNLTNDQAAKALINVVSKSGFDNIKHFLRTLCRLDINSTNKYNIDSFESKVIKMAIDTDVIISLKNKTFIDGTPLTEIQFNNEFEVPYNAKNISFKLSDLIGYDAPDLNQLKFNFDIHTNNFFEATDYLLDEIVEELKVFDQLSNPQQVGFLITQDVYPDEFKIFVLDESELLDYLYLNDFSKVYNIFKKFIIWVISDDAKYKLEEEKPENWLLSWYDNSVEKQTWLKKNWIRFGDCLAIQLRKNFIQKWDERDIKQEAKNSQRAKNTLKWIKKNENIDANQYGPININKFVEEYTIKHEKLPDYLLTVNLVTNEHELFESDNLEFLKAIWQQNFNLEQYLKAKESVINKTGVEAWIDFSNITQDKSINLIKELVRKLEVKDVVDQDKLPNLNDKEWSEAFYQKWKEEYANKYKIYLLEELVNKKLDVKCGDDKWSISGATSECEYQKMGSEYIIYLKSDSSKKPIQVLEANYKKAFQHDPDKFIKLQKCYIDQSLNPEEIEKQDLVRGYTTTQLADAIAKGTSGKTGDLNAPNWTDEEKAKFDELREKLKKLMNDEDAGEKLDEMLKDKDPKINTVSGHIGERLVYYWLNFNYPELVNHINENEYDLLLDLNNIEYHIEVKTTVGSIEVDGNSIPVYLRKSQRKFIAENKSDNYFLIMVGLDDVGLKSSFYKEFKGKVLTEKRKVAIDNFLSDWIILNNQEVSIHQYHLRLTTKQNLQEKDPFNF